MTRWELHAPPGHARPAWLGELQELMDLARRGAVPGFPVHTRPMNEVNAVLNSLRAGEIVGRSVVVPEAA